MAGRLDHLISGQKRFLGDVAHELCGPLARLRTGLGILEQRLPEGESERLESIDEEGWPIDVRVGRHTSTLLMTMEMWTEINPDRPLICRRVPRYDEVIANGTGHYLRDPAGAPSGRVIFE